MTSWNQYFYSLRSSELEESGQSSGAQKKIGKWGYSEALSGNT